MNNSLELWEDGPRVPLPDKPSDYTLALAWVSGVLAGIGVLGAFFWWLCYYLPFRAMSCDDVYDSTGQTVVSVTHCHRVMNDNFAYVFDGVLGAVVLTILLALLTAGLRNLRK